MNGRSIHVCHVSAGLVAGGLEELLVSLVTSDLPGVSHSFVALGPLGEVADRLSALGCEVASVHLMGDRRRGWGRLVALLRARRPDIVHCHNTYAQAFGATAAVRARVPARLTTQHMGGKAPGWRDRVFALVGNRFVSTIATVSEQGFRDCRRHDPLAARKVRLIRNGIAVHGIIPDPVAGGPVVAVGRLFDEKDHACLIRAWALLAERGCEQRLEILGEGPERSNLEALIAEFGLARLVTLRGHCEDVADRLRTSSLYVSASTAEGISLALLEAMSHGLPCVVTDVGDNAAVLGPDPYGAIVPPRDPAALADALEQALSAGVDRDAAFATARRVREHFSLSVMADAYVELYRRLAEV